MYCKKKNCWLPITIVISSVNKVYMKLTVGGISKSKEDDCSLISVKKCKENKEAASSKTVGCL